jgi:hypothetical protein
MAKGRIPPSTRKTKKMYAAELKQVKLENRELRQKQEVYRAQLKRLLIVPPMGPRPLLKGGFTPQNTYRTYDCRTLYCKGDATVRGALCPFCKGEEKSDESDEGDSGPDEDSPPGRPKPPSPPAPLQLVSSS